MKNIIEYMYKNIENKDKIIAQFIDKNDDKKITNLTISEVLKFKNYLYSKFGTSNFDRKIGILMNNNLGFVNSFYSIILNGYIVVGINNKVGIEELDSIIKQNQLEIIISTNEFMDLLQKVEIKNIVNYNNLNLSNFTDEINLVKKFPELNDVMVISYTSGTSGNFSKPVELTFGNISFVSEEYKKVYKLQENSKCITVLPLWHNYAMFACLTSSIVANSSIIIMEEWNLELFIKINELLKPDIFPGSPYMYIDIINHSNLLHKLNNLKICDSGGDSLPIECIKKFEEITGAVITEGYGLTETTSLTHFNYSAKERKVGSLGKCVSDTYCKILDLNGNELPNNTWGLLWIKGPMVFKGYVGKKKSELDNLTEDGWFNTNDIVKRDDDGFYFYAGRFTDIKMLGESEEQLRILENKLYQFSGIKRVHIRTSINKVGNFLYFDIVAELNENYSIQDLYDYINTNLKKFVINDVKIVDKLPVTGTGKIKRNKINTILDKNA